MRLLGKIVACRRFSWNVFRIHLKITKIIKEYLQIQMLYVFLNITPWLDLMKLLILVYKKPLKILIWLLETDDFVPINQKQSAVMVERLDIVHQRLKFWLTLVKIVVFWTIRRRNNIFMYHCWWLPSKLPLLQWLSIENQQGCDNSDVSFILTIFPKNFWNKWYLIWKPLNRAIRISKKIGRGFILRVATPP